MMANEVIELCVGDDLQEFLNLHGQQLFKVVEVNEEEVNEGTTNDHDARVQEQCTWTRPMVLTLINEHKENFSRVGKSLKSLKVMFTLIASKLNKTFKTNLSGDQVNNKWKSLERSYKKKKDNDRSTGRGAKYFEYEAELDEVFCKSKKIYPDLLLSENEVITSEASLPIPAKPSAATVATSHPPSVIVDVAEDEHEDDVIGDLDFEDENRRRETPSTSTPKLNRKSKKSTKSRNDILLMMREDRQKYYDKKLQLLKERNEERMKRNELTKESNALLLNFLSSLKPT
ncbi:hypothetical protein GE061_000172 [Apolygus lucorum]|uniref:Myb/SANT-like DNA-binding domain-containing protein n=1 Tax=Apolygus lucorum TaxID=248454 RepID=A0A6A4KNV7_APOLU|nr:hypothetical protein GE061_000172 [Apolygus lucorum]